MLFSQSHVLFFLFRYFVTMSCKLPGVTNTGEQEKRNREGETHKQQDNERTELDNSK